MQNSLKISIFVLCGIIVALTSCKEKKICAAYNSYFVYDEVNIGAYFTPFGKDSIPLSRDSKRFNNNGALTKSGKRNDQELIKYTAKEIKEAGKAPGDSAAMANHDDSLGSILNVKELFPEKINTDQEAYDHYVGELLKKYQKESKKTEEPADSMSYYNNPPPDQTKEEKKEWKRQKKAYKKRQKEKMRQEQEDALKEEEEDEFDFDLDE